MPLGVTMRLHEVTSTWEVTLGLQEVTKGPQVDVTSWRHIGTPKGIKITF